MAHMHARALLAITSELLAGIVHRDIAKMFVFFSGPGMQAAGLYHSDPGGSLWVVQSMTWLGWGSSFSQWECPRPEYLLANPFSLLACKIIF